MEELAAERERNNADFIDRYRDVEELRQQLAAASNAEDQRLLDLGVEIHQLKQQLAAHDRDQWKLLIDGQHRAICGKCGYPELVGSDDCRNCSSNFNHQIGYGDKHDEEVRKPLVDALERIRNEAVTLVEARKHPNSVLHIEAPQRIKAIANDALAKVKEGNEETPSLEVL